MNGNTDDTTPAEPLRCVTFYPYTCDPCFRLTMFDTHRRTEDGKEILRYELVERDHGREWLLFTGDDFACSPLHAIDSDETMVALMRFLCLQPGDTDDEYFKDYNDRQRAFAETNASALFWEVEARLAADAVEELT